MHRPLSASRSAILASFCALALIGGSAQCFAAAAGTGALPVPAHHAAAEESRMTARVRDGVYTVDGMVAKVKLNYDVQDSSFVYLFVPGLGTAVVSATPAPDAMVTPVALQDDELNFVVGGHHFDLTGVNLASDKGTVLTHLYVHLDRSAWRLSRLPMIGFGNRAAMPYEWPGALPPESAEETQALPPIPANLLPALMEAAPVHPAALSPVALHTQPMP